MLLLVNESLGQRTVVLNAAVAQERPPAAHLLGALHVYLDDNLNFLILRCFVEKLALWSGYERGAPEGDTGSWLLAIGSWLLAVGCWLKANSVYCDDG